MTTFYVFTIGKKFLKITNLKLSLVTDIGDCAYWTKKRSALSWSDWGYFKKKFPNAKLRVAVLTLKSKKSLK